MRKRFLGIICLLYSGIIAYVIITDKLKNFLAPTMQIYIKLSLVSMIIIGLVMLINNKEKYRFKLSDLVLILPLILLIFAGDGRLTSSFASNRMVNYNRKNQTQTKEKVCRNPEKIEPITEPEEKIEEKYDFSKPYFEIIDANYSELADYLTFAPKADKFNGKTIKVKGFALRQSDYLEKGYFALGKYTISCCAADAAFTGFIVKYDETKIAEDKWYEIEGVLEKGKDKEGYDIMYINPINIKEINSKKEEQYVYPCYAYDDGKCEAVMKYDIEY